jgi:hypothetical protein
MPAEQLIRQHRKVDRSKNSVTIPPGDDHGGVGLDSVLYHVLLSPWTARNLTSQRVHASRHPVPLGVDSKWRQMTA